MNIDTKSVNKEQDYKFAMKNLLKSKEFDDLLLILDYNIDDKVNNIVTEPNVNNLYKHKIELALYQSMKNTFEYYKENLGQI